MTREEAKAVVEKLVNRFAEQRNGYHAADYNETKTRRDFIDPLFTAFGWDMDNKDDVAEPYREVIHEDKVKIQGKTKAPDYGFRLSGSKDRLFFVEAKKPSVALKTNKEAAFQVRRYGWNSGASVSILTNFEEFSIYDCSKKPSATESSTVARLKYFTYDQLLTEFDFFYDIFSREAVVKGRFDNYIKSDTAKKGTQTPDKEFVVSLDKWRKFIAIDIAKSNLKLNEDELNFAVQLIIDRLIFLRFCEDRGVETYGQLKTAVSKGDAYKNLCGVFKDADNKYNSGLFDFKKDQITQTLKVTNKIIKGVVEDLYSPNCEYDFKALPVEVLGNAYEQFLGKVIRINRAHHAVIEEKPEVRKAGGVYYTPEYIVDYIVDNTLGKLIKDKTPKEIEKIKVVDPACGSGSFLLGAFQYLLNFHAEYYHKNGYAGKKTKDNPLTPHGTLSTAEKKKILLNNIYGVDIDANAVEVTKLSLLLKCMEGETDASIKQQFNMFHERVLPDLDNNIKDGNSLVDTDFYDYEFDLGFEKKIKPFSWKKAFPEVFKQGGFDIVIGNPPYGAEFSEEQKKYLLKKYTHQNYQLDSYLVFLEQAIKLLLKDDGDFGMIIPNPWVTNLLQKKLRKFVFENVCVKEIVHFKDPVFVDATVDTEVLLLSKSNPKTNKIKITLVEKGNDLFKHKNAEIIHLQKDWIAEDGDVINIFLSDDEKQLFRKIRYNTNSLETYNNINVGIKPYQVGKGSPKQTRNDVEDRVFDSDKKKDKTFRKYLRGKDINRYVVDPLEERYISFGEWLAEPRYSANFDSEIKIFMRQTGDSLIATIDTEKLLCLNNMHVLVPKKENQIDTFFLLGIINSKLLNWYYQTLNPEKGEALAEVKKSNVARLPIRIINTKNKKVHDQIAYLAQSLLKLNEQTKKIKIQNKIDQHNRHIFHNEEKINNLVYELYELTPEEIKIIEDANS